MIEKGRHLRPWIFQHSASTAVEVGDERKVMRKFSRMAKNSPHLRVLIVDDEPLIRWSLAETLTDSGHSVIEAGDGEVAVHSLTHGDRPFDVVLLVYRLPYSNDLNLLSTSRRG